MGPVLDLGSPAEHDAVHPSAPVQVVDWLSPAFSCALQLLLRHCDSHETGHDAEFAVTLVSGRLAPDEDDGAVAWVSVLCQTQPYRDHSSA